MKKLLLLVLLCGSFGAMGQTAAVPSDTAFAGATKIIIHTPDSGQAALQNIARLLISKGFPSEKLEPSLGYFSTGPVKLGGSSTAVSTCKLSVLQSAKNPREYTITGAVGFIGRYGASNKPMSYTRKITYERMAFFTTLGILKEYTGATFKFAN